MTGTYDYETVAIHTIQSQTGALYETTFTFPGKLSQVDAAEAVRAEYENLGLGLFAPGVDEITEAAVVHYLGTPAE